MINFFKCASFVSLFIFAALCAKRATAQTDEWDLKYTNGIAAVVEDRIITLEELRLEVAPLVPQIRRDSIGRADFDRKIEEVTREVLQNLVDRILIIRDFRRSKYQIPPTYIDNELDDYITKEFNGDRSEFVRFLKSQGKSMRQFREELTERIIVNFMRSQNSTSYSEISPQRIETFYQKHKFKFIEEKGVRLRVIVLAPIPNEGHDVLKQTANAIMNELAAGEGFAQLAKKYSDDPSADEGGLWPWYGRNELKKDLATAAFSLEKGSYSQPIELDGYIYILYVEDKREEGVKEIEKVRNEIEAAIAARLARESQQQWLEKLRKDAYIKYFLEEASPAK